MKLATMVAVSRAALEAAENAEREARQYHDAAMRAVGRVVHEASDDVLRALVYAALSPVRPAGVSDSQNDLLVVEPNGTVAYAVPRAVVTMAAVELRRRQIASGTV
jgi:hypothetical protein